MDILVMDTYTINDQLFYHTYIRGFIWNIQQLDSLTQCNNNCCSTNILNVCDALNWLQSEWCVIQTTQTTVPAVIRIMSPWSCNSISWHMSLLRAIVISILFKQIYWGLPTCLYPRLYTALVTCCIDRG